MKRAIMIDVTGLPFYQQEKVHQLGSATHRFVLYDEQILGWLNRFLNSAGCETDIAIHAVDKINKYCKGKRITHLCTSNTEFGYLVTFLIKGGKTDPKPVPNNGYAFSYVLNADTDWCSEFGDILVENGRRVG